MQQTLEKTHNYENIPEEMKSHEQWVLYTLKWDENQQKFTKIPRTIKGDHASSTDPKTWTSYSTAIKVFESTGDFDGLGFVFTENDPFVVVDFDDCIIDGKISEERIGIINSFDSYTEVSQSGEGLHVVAKGDDIGQGFNNHHEGIEMYSNKRFIAMTGNLLEGATRLVNDAYMMVPYLDDTYRPSTTPKNATPVEDQPEVYSNDHILMKARNSKNSEKFIDLFDKGNVGNYFLKNDKVTPDWSAADQALANILAWWTKNIDQIERLMRQSALYREKWDRKESTPYLSGRTIPNALQTVKGGYGEQDNFQLHVNENEQGSPKFALNEDSSVKKILYNLKLMLLQHKKLDDIGFNQFTEEVTLKGEPITDYDISEMRMWVDTNFYMTFKKDDILDVMGVIAREHNSYHPIKQLIESRAWDGTKRAESIFIDYLGADDDHYNRSVARKWLSGAIARIYEPGIKMDIVPVLQGKQGLGKSTMPNKLGGDYFMDSLMSLGNNKDDYQMLIDSWIIELSELSSVGTTQIEKVKGFISAQSDKMRLPYGKVTQNYPRTCAFIGTTNTSQFLNDLTGNRRFFPVPLKYEPEKDVFSLDDETIRQIWAEAYQIYKNGEKLFLDDELDQDMADIYRQEATEEDMLFSDIELFLEMKVPEDWDTIDNNVKRDIFTAYKDKGKYTAHDEKHCTSFITKTTSREISFILGLETSNRSANAMLKKINMYMENKDGWKKQSVRMNGKPQAGFKRL